MVGSKKKYHRYIPLDPLIKLCQISPGKVYRERLSILKLLVTQIVEEGRGRNYNKLKS